MPQPGDDASRAQVHADVEGAVLEEPIGGPKDNRPPLWTWAVLVVAILTLSSAASAFKLLSDVPPITLGAWRLQLTGLLLLPGALIQYGQLSPELKQRTRESGLVMVLSGAALALHFAFWVEGIENTSIPHALFFSSITPIIIAGGMWALGLPISNGEIAGTCLGFVGGVLLAGGGAQEGQVTILGDLSCVVGPFSRTAKSRPNSTDEAGKWDLHGNVMTSVCIIPYLFIGRMLRSWMPLFVYAHAVTAMAGGMLAVAAVLGGASVLAPGIAGVAGWLQSPAHAPALLYLGVVPGILGHTGLNSLLKYLHPLLLTLSLTLEPLVGSVIGWMLGLAQPPGVYTWVGGAVLLASTVMVVIFGHRREQSERTRGLQQG